MVQEAALLTANAQVEFSNKQKRNSPTLFSFNFRSLDQSFEISQTVKTDFQTLLIMAQVFQSNDEITYLEQVICSQAPVRGLAEEVGTLQFIVKLLNTFHNVHTM